MQLDINQILMMKTQAILFSLNSIRRHDVYSYEIISSTHSDKFNYTKKIMAIWSHLGIICILKCTIENIYLQNCHLYMNQSIGMVWEIMNYI